MLFAISGVAVVAAAFNKAFMCVCVLHCFFIAFFHCFSSRKKIIVVDNYDDAADNYAAANKKTNERTTMMLLSFERNEILD